MFPVDHVDLDFADDHNDLDDGQDHLGHSLDDADDDIGVPVESRVKLGGNSDDASSASLPSHALHDDTNKIILVIIRLMMIMVIMIMIILMRLVQFLIQGQN